MDFLLYRVNCDCATCFIFILSFRYRIPLMNRLAAEYRMRLLIYFLFFDKLRNAMIKLSVSAKNILSSQKCSKNRFKIIIISLSFLASENQRLSQTKNASSSKLRFYIQLSLQNTVSVFILRVNIYDKHFAFHTHFA